MFIYSAIKQYEELWRIEDRACSGRLNEGRSRYQNRTGTDTPKSALEAEDHIPKAEHIDPIKSCLIRDDLHMRAHLRSKGHLLSPTLMEIRQTRAKRLLQWHAENGHENILYMDEKIFTIEEQYNKILWSKVP